jgi:hypothetical protein
MLQHLLSAAGNDHQAIAVLECNKNDAAWCWVALIGFIDGWLSCVWYCCS